MMKTDKNLAIYVHIPFCECKCSYCAFASFVADETTRIKYFKALEKEIDNYSKQYGNRRITSIFFGGGTPSCVEPLFIEKIVEKLKKHFNFEDVEMTIECNPNSIDKAKLDFYHKIGFNRISFGVQSLDDITLGKLGRLHTRAQALLAIDCAQKCGFDNISADLLIGVENQTKDMLIKDAITLLAHNVKHLSAYMLTVEENTKLFDMVSKNKVALPNEDDCVDMYDELYNVLTNKGFHRYEVSNFSIVGFESKHNLNYWRCGDYLGVGLSAHSFVDGKRFSNTASLDKYIAGSHLQSEENIDKDRQIEEYVMLALRLEQGLDLEDYFNKFGEKLEDVKNSEIEELVNYGYITITNGRLCVSPKKFGVLNQIILKLI